MRIGPFERGERAGIGPAFDAAAVLLDGSLGVDGECMPASNVTTDRFIAPFTVSTAVKTSPLRSLRAAHRDGRPEVGREAPKRDRRRAAAPGDRRARRRAPLVATTRSVGVFTLTRSRSSRSTTFSIDPAQRELADGDTPLELREHRLRVHARQRAGRCDARASMSSRSSRDVTSGQSTGRTTDTSWVAARNAGDDAVDRRPLLRAVVHDGNGRSSPSAALPTAMHLRARLLGAFGRRARRSVSPRNRASAFGEPNRSEAPPTSSTPVAARRSATARCRRSRGHRAPSRRPSCRGRRELDRERRRRADRDQDRAAGHGRLLHELEREPAADAQDASRERQPPSRNAQPTTLSIALWRPTSSRRHDKLAVGVEQPGRVQSAGRRERRLRLAQPRPGARQ